MENEQLIKLLSETLKFYSEIANYDNNQIINDRGFQARFVIDLVNKNNKTMDSLEKEYDELTKNIEEKISSDETISNILNEINKIKEE